MVNQNHLRLICSGYDNAKSIYNVVFKNPTYKYQPPPYGPTPYGIENQANPTQTKLLKMLDPTWHVGSELWWVYILCQIPAGKQYSQH